MPLASSACEESVEECIEALDDLVMSLDHHPPWAVIQAMATHLEALLHAIFAAGECSTRDVADLLREIGRGALH